MANQIALGKIFGSNNDVGHGAYGCQSISETPFQLLIAQQSAMPVVEFVTLRGLLTRVPFLMAFRHGMNVSGFINIIQ